MMRTMTFCSSICFPSLSVVVVVAVFPVLPIHHPIRHHPYPTFRPSHCHASSRAVDTVAVASNVPGLRSGTSPAPARRPFRACASGLPRCRTRPSCPSCRVAERAAVRPPVSRPVVAVSGASPAPYNRPACCADRGVCGRKSPNST
uniref:Putative secreted peptide n=1 Tax=Anopheles braziliensis TaxID=58242 RepID=A0A2M3ZSX0_9DIPT